MNELNKSTERSRIYRAANRQKTREAARKYRAKNANRINANKRAKYAANPNKKSRPAAYYREWRAKNPEKSRAIAARGAKKDVAKKRVRVRNRRARQRAADGYHTAVQIECLAKMQKFRCANTGCRKSIKNGHQADHIVPLVRGGSNWIRNIQLLCAHCNQCKNAKDPIDWARDNGMLL
jgi:5-methylcytosine-specific restriction endonuclease McrA